MRWFDAMFGRLSDRTQAESETECLTAARLALLMEASRGAIMWQSNGQGLGLPDNCHPDRTFEPFVI